MSSQQTVHGIHVDDRGAGTAILMIAGAGGDGDLFGPVARDLAQTNRILTYDRRGNSRSPRPAGWSTTTLRQQADDATRVLDAAGVTTAHVLGTSGGGVIALELARIHPDRVSRLLLHEPALVHALPEGPALHDQLGERLSDDRAEVGAEGALERFLRFAYGDQSWETVDPDLRRRIASNGPVFLDVEFDVLTNGRPPHRSEILPASHVLRGPDGPAFLEPLCELVAAELDTTVVAAPGGHLGYLTHPEAFATTVRRVLQEARA